MNNESIDRRDFFRYTSLVAGAAAVPAFVARAYGMQDPQDKDQSTQQPADREVALRAARRRATARQKPILVLVVPAEPGPRYERGQRLGGLLNHGGEDVLLDLALCEVACATVAEVEKVLGTERIGAEPLLLLVEPARSNWPDAAGGRPVRHAPRVTALDPELDKVPVFDGTRTWEAQVEAEAEHVRATNAKIAAALHGAVARDRAELVERADRARESLAPDDRAALERFFGGGPAPRSELLLHAAGVVRMAAEAPRRAGDRERLCGALEKVARKALVEERVGGSKWAKSTGCGTEIEGENDDQAMMVACGMGHVPKLCERFLYFYSE